MRQWRKPVGDREGLRRLVKGFQPMPGLVDTPHEVYLSRHAVKVGEPSG